MGLKININEEWKDDLIWCPSQCELNLYIDGRYYVLYLRWRGGDPWTASLIRCSSNTHCITSTEYDWYNLDVDFWKDTELYELKENALNLAKETIYKGDY